MGEGRLRGSARWRAATLAAWLGVPSVAAAATPSAASIEARFSEGQSHFEGKEYLQAAEIFADVLADIEEVLPNRATRENVMVNVLLAYEWAYRSSTGPDGSKDITLLDAGHEVVQAYMADLQRVYGADATPTPPAAGAMARYEDARQIAHEAHGEPDDAAQIGPCLQPSSPPPTAEARGCGRSGGEPGYAWVGLLAVPTLRRRRRALDRLADRLPPDVVARLRRRDDAEDA